MYFLCAYELFLVLFPQACFEHDRSSRSDLQVELNYDNLNLDSLSDLISSSPHLNSISESILSETAKNPFIYLREQNYYYENHSVTTEDGYILLVVRIPFGKKRTPNKKRPPVIFVHGIFCTFFDFLNAGPGRSIGFEILEQGYDLWLINTRGNTYSRKHVTLDPVLNASAFWDFSWHEVGYYDVPATMDYINNVTGFSNVSIVGHSQGGTVYLAFAASRKEYDKRITFSLQLAPVSYLTNAKQPIVNALKNNLNTFDALVRKYNVHEMLSFHKVYSQAANLACNKWSPISEVCVILLKLLGGPSGQTNRTFIPTLVANHPAGSSVKHVRHYIQIAISDKFQLYDYGTEGNKRAYNQATPPLYNLSAIVSPVAIYYGKSDSFISEIDGARLARQIPNAMNFVLGFDTNHLDVQWGTKAVENVHRPAIKLLNKYNKMRNVL